MKKAYRIIQTSNFRNKEELAYLSSKSKAIEYIKSCIGILVDEKMVQFRCRHLTNKDVYRYNENAWSCLTRKECLNWLFLVDEFHKYYIEEIEII